LVTGAAGFVGHHLVPRLQRDAHDIIETDRELDVSDVHAVTTAVERIRPHAIVHLAAQSSVAHSMNAPAETYRTNYLGTRSVLEAALHSTGDVRVLLVTSADTYGSASPGSPPFTEASPLRPNSPYARSKAAADLLGAHYAARGLAVVRARSFNHTGPGQHDSFVLPSFARQLAEIASGQRESQLHVGNLDSVRDFLDVRDVVEAYARMLEPGVPLGAYNVSSGIGTTLRDHLETLMRLSGVEPAVDIDPKRFRPTDHSVGASAKLGEATGWAPQFPFADTLGQLVDYWRDRVSGA
jgi:GDP-4-dehydro-6-deoxy-D-mannose reductase